MVILNEFKINKVFINIVNNELMFFIGCCFWGVVVVGWIVWVVGLVGGKGGKGGGVLL